MNHLTTSFDVPLDEVPRLFRADKSMCIQSVTQMSETACTESATVNFSGSAQQLFDLIKTTYEQPVAKCGVVHRSNPS